MASFDGRPLFTMLTLFAVLIPLVLWNVPGPMPCGSRKRGAAMRYSLSEMVTSAQHPLLRTRYHSPNATPDATSVWATSANAGSGTTRSACATCI